MYVFEKFVVGDMTIKLTHSSCPVIIIMLLYLLHIT